MKKITETFGLILFAALLTATMPLQKYAVWQLSLSEEGPEVGELVTLRISADITTDWYLYSNDFDKNLGPMLTTFSFEENDTYELVGETIAISPKRKYDDIWEGEMSYFTKKAVFEQQVRILQEDFQINVEVKGQVCSDATGKCVLVNERLEMVK